MVKAKLNLKKNTLPMKIPRKQITVLSFYFIKYDINLSHYEVIFGNPQPTQFFYGTCNQCVCVNFANLKL